MNKFVTKVWRRLHGKLSNVCDPPACRLALMPTNTEIEFISDEPLESLNMRCPAILIQLQAWPIRTCCIGGRYTTIVKVNGAHAYVWRDSEEDL